MHTLHNSSRALYRRCRRRWAWTYRDQLIPDPEEGGRDARGALWAGTGFHFALEDYHGYRRFSNPEYAFEAYVAATLIDDNVPDNYEELQELMCGMLRYYTDHWLPRRDEFKTLWIDGIPQVEVPFEIQVGVCHQTGPHHEHPGADANSTGGHPILFAGTFDRIVVDPWDRIWVQDYKTCAQFDTKKLPNDAQVSSYSLAGSLLYGDRLEGVLYTQFRKAVPDYPVVLKNGGLSQSKSQKTTWSMYVQALTSRYGEIPDEYVDYANYLAGLEQPEGDAFIRQDLVQRNPYQRNNEMAKIRAEAREMLDPELALYPNPTRDCAWDCPFREPCIGMDDGSDWEQLLEVGFIKLEDRSVRDDSWRNKIEWPMPTVLPSLG